MNVLGFTNIWMIYELRVICDLWFVYVSALILIYIFVYTIVQ